jgi:hypothetical protein
MKLNQIAKNLALAGMLSSLSITAFAAAPQQDATPATREANQALYANCRLRIKPTLTPIRVLSPPAASDAQRRTGKYYLGSRQI